MSAVRWAEKEEKRLLEHALKIADKYRRIKEIMDEEI